MPGRGFNLRESVSEHFFAARPNAGVAASAGGESQKLGSNHAVLIERQTKDVSFRFILFGPE